MLIDPKSIRHYRLCSTIYNVTYRDGKEGTTYIKRFAVTSVVRDREYDVTQEMCIRDRYRSHIHSDKEYTKSISHLLSYASMYMTNL